MFLSMQSVLGRRTIASTWVGAPQHAMWLGTGRLSQLRALSNSMPSHDKAEMSNTNWPARISKHLANLVSKVRTYPYVQGMGYVTYCT